jgi:hypothetical protein
MNAATSAASAFSLRIDYSCLERSRMFCNTRLPTGAAPTEPRNVARINLFRRKLLSSSAVRCYWVANLIALGGLCAWIFSDGLFANTVRLFPDHLWSFVGQGPEMSDPQLFSRLVLLDIVLLITGTSGFGIFMGLFFSDARQRGLRYWLAFTAIVAIWLTLALNWRDLQWRGQVHRARLNVDALSALATSLQQSWPTIDGETPELGPFQAYPIAKPQVLLLFSQKQMPGATAPISAINRSKNGTLRFQLAGNETGTWLEWHPHDAPGDFVSGLDQRFVLNRGTAVGENWYLVRYE